MCDSDRRAAQILQRLERRGLVERVGRGREAKFRITAAGRGFVPVSEPASHWNKPWDGKWRVFGYDLPESRRKDRVLLWRALRAHKLGWLQRSMWVWPHEVESLLQSIIEAEGIPECFCGFESVRPFLCTSSEIVDSAWDFREIDRRHEMYLTHAVATPSLAKSARDLKGLAHVDRVERQAYQHAFSIDPLLPRVLWPKGYRGADCEKRHQQFRAALCRRAHELTRPTKLRTSM
jgi:DNA-binding transcriptional regulator PaaX